MLCEGKFLMSFFGSGESMHLYIAKLLFPGVYNLTVFHIILNTTSLSLSSDVASMRLLSYKPLIFSLFCSKYMV